ncbi:hypothetical protein ID866_3403 [Astraeus odoratus]|nr:hypothetical protein ID866_3403 [Astraeus odoratus]
MLDVDALPSPGTKLFLPSLLAHVRSALPGFPAEPVIIQVLLLCITSGDRNLILRTRDEDVGLVARLATLVSTCRFFGYTVHKYKCHVDAWKQTPSQFLQSLLLSTSTVAAVTDGPFGPSHKYRERRQRATGSRNSGGKLSVATVAAAHVGKTSIPRSLSCPCDSRPSPSTLHRGNPDASESTANDDRQTSAATDARRPALLSSKAHTEPCLSTLPLEGPVSRPTTADIGMPTAVVVSGLEHASIQSQKALLWSLANRRLVVPPDGPSETSQTRMVFDLPQNFVLVYVCRLDERERPPIYKSLLDRFAMSSPVNVSPQTRIAVRQFRPPSTPPPRTLGTSTDVAGYFSGPPTPPMVESLPPAIPPSLLRSLKGLCANYTRMRPLLNIYLADLFTATRHFGSLDGTLLTLRARQDAEALIRASRVLGVDPTGAELIKEAVSSAMPAGDIESVSTQPSYPPSHLSASVSSDALLGAIDMPEIREPSLSPSAQHSISTWEKNALDLDVSEADIARIFPRVVSHRVRVRDSPYDEVLSSAVWGAVGTCANTDGEEMTWERDTVKDILVQILSEV